VNNAGCNRKTVESLVKAGAFDSTGYTRRQMMRFLEIDNLMDIAAKRHRDKADGQVSMFDLFEEHGTDSGFEEDIPEPDGVEWDRRIKLAYEKEIMKFYISDHPLSPYATTLKQISDYSLAVLMRHNDDEDATDNQIGEQELIVPENRSITLAGMVSNLTPMVSKKGGRMAKFELEDMEGKIEAIIFPQPFEKCGAQLEDEAIVRVRCRYERSDRGSQIIVSDISPIYLEDAKAQHSIVELKIYSSAFNQLVSNQLTVLLHRYPGSDPVVLNVIKPDGGFLRVELPSTVDSSSSELHRELIALLGPGTVNI
ncbi:MAG: DNA polymerase III subunit alpha, partial [Coriobacteriaceae bacterium]|nr:DNA polymerase III subunit alpha [Coriobacteriaceae bacterium]